MRANTTRAALTRTANAIIHDTPKRSFTRPAYICASCLHQQRANPSQSRPTNRHFSTSPPSRQEKPTHYTLFPQTFPSGPPPNSPFTPDLRALRKEYLLLQQKSHPDLSPTTATHSALINEAYKTLQEPLKRAQYLLSLQGIDVEDESAKLSENELLMEVMEAREAVEEVESEEELTGIRQENNERIEKSVQVLDEVFAKGDLETAAQEAIRLRYWMNIEESIQGWEKGKGGGIIHH